MAYFYKVADKKLATLIEQDLERFVDKWQDEKTIGSHEPIDAFCDVMLRGGKRLRGILAMQSYYAHGGQDEVVALGAARVFELIQTSLLVVDDIADRSLMRRGGIAAHERIRMYAHDHNLRVDTLHYGEVQAMNVAYAGLHQATIELLNLPVSSRIARSACKRFHENIATTINGQIDDIYNQATSEPVSEEDVESVLIRKTAYYTILSPIELGAYLAGVTSIPQNLREYSIHTGCAFQIADDIISTFGEAGETGKGNNDDIHEGKLTLLAYYALIHGTAVQKEELKEVLGKTEASGPECDRVRKLFEDTGALQYARMRLELHKEKALAAIEGSVSSVDPTFVTYLKALTDYVVKRQV